MNKNAREFNQNMPALDESSMAVNSLEFFMAELLQDQRIIRGDSDDDVILVPDNAKLPSNASQFSQDGSQTSFTEGMGGFASPKGTQSRLSDSFLTPACRWESSPKGPKKDCLTITPPRRLPEHNDSFRIHRQKYPRRGGFMIQSQNGSVSRGRDETFTNLNLNTSSQENEESLDTSDNSKNRNKDEEDMAEIVQALREIDAECSPHNEGRFPLPSSLQ
jgi:hypothetical protein